MTLSPSLTHCRLGKSRHTVNLRRTWLRLGAGALALLTYAPMALAQEPGKDSAAKSEVLAGEEAKLEAATTKLASIREQYGLPALWAARYDLGEDKSQYRRAVRFVEGTQVIGTQQAASWNDKIHLGSCTKAMTAALVAIELSQNESLSWQSTLAEAFPDNPEVGQSPWAGVTLASIVRHRGGLPANALWHTIQQTTKDDILVERREVLSWLLKQTPPKQVDFEYSNTGFAILGHILECLHEQPWEEQISERLFLPLGIKSAGFGPPSRPDGRRQQQEDENAAAPKQSQPHGHYVAPDVSNTLKKIGSLFGGKPTFDLSPIEVDNARPLGPAGRVHMNVDDWARFLSMFAAGEESRTAKKLGIDKDNWVALTATGEEGNYGAGWIVVDRGWAGGKVLSHSGSNTTWHCVTWVAPNRKFFVLAATNCLHDQTGQALDDAVSELIRRFPEVQDDAGSAAAE
ncbi:MAG TPA: hypothetical protein DDW52_29985 [Planctomycetaceae bacterium]|nr:hypothetical protein [Planctomycetaceae bacterium]